MVFKKLNSRPGRIICCQAFHRLLKQYGVFTGYPFIWHLFTLERAFVETFEGLAWGLPGGCLGVTWGLPGGWEGFSSLSPQVTLSKIYPISLYI